MIEAEVVAPPQRPSRKVRWIGAILVALLILLGLYAWMANRTGGTHYRFVIPGQGASGRIGSIPVAAAPDLAAEGVAIKFVSQAAQVDQIAFICREVYSVEVEISAGQPKIEELSYALIGPDDDELSAGKVKLANSIEPEGKGSGLIEDNSIPRAARILIRK